MKRILVLMVALLAAFSASARETYSLNNSWRFYTTLESDATMVSLPHCYETSYSGVGNYVRQVNIPSEWASRRLFLRFGAAGTVATLLVNGRLVGEHRGGGLAFGFEITEFVNYGTHNLVQVIVSNAPRTDILPTASTGVQWGGLYGTAELWVTDAQMIEGVEVRSAKVSSEAVGGNVALKINSASAGSVNASVTIIAPDGAEVFTENKKINAAKGISEIQLPFTIYDPKLWGGVGDANLYRVVVMVGDDVLETRTGFRYFATSAKDGFRLNGNPYSLRGVVLWRDRPLGGGIASREELARDLDIITEMGSNAIRIAEGAYYDEFYSLCDERGIVVMSDLPFVGEATFLGHGYYPSEEFRANAFSQYGEQISQQFNHPSILFWGIFTNPSMKGDNSLQFITDLNKFVKSADPQRLTVGVSNSDGDVNRITDLIVWDHNLGWREGMPSDIAIWREQYFSTPQWSTIRSAISYRAGGELAAQSAAHSRPDYSSSYHPETWQTYFHRTYLETFSDDRRFWAIWVGDMFDYASLTAPSGSVKNMTDYGLVTRDRTKRKDSYYLYKATWGSEKVVYISSRRNTPRTDMTQNIVVFSSCDSVTLNINGTPVSTQPNRGGVFVWNNVSLQMGENKIEAVGDGKYSDIVHITITKQQL